MKNDSIMSEIKFDSTCNSITLKIDRGSDPGMWEPSLTVLKPLFSSKLKISIDDRSSTLLTALIVSLNCKSIGQIRGSIGLKLVTMD